MTHLVKETLLHTESKLPGLYATTPHPLPFAPSLEIRSYLLRRKRGNVLVYGAPLVEGDLQAIADLGGISRHYLDHRHEASFAGDALRSAARRTRAGSAPPSPRAWAVAETFSRALRRSTTTSR